MADTKVSALPAASAVAGANEFPINEAAVSKKVSATQLAAWMFEGRGLDVKKHFGAIGDGVVNDTVALQAAFDSDVPIYIPVGTYKVTATLIVPLLAHIQGAGYNSVIQASSVTGPVVRIPDTIGDFNGFFGGVRISGTATAGLEVGVIDATDTVCLDHIWLTGTFTDGFVFGCTFGGSLTNLWTNDATITGKCFSAGSGFNANFCGNWYTSNQAAYNFYFDAAGGALGPLAGNTFAALTAQGGTIGLFLGQVQANTFTSFYSEEVVKPIVIGDYDAGSMAVATVFVSPYITGASSGHPNYSQRVVCVDISYASGLSLEGPFFGTTYNIATAAPLSFSGGGGSGAEAVARVTAGGVVSSAEVMWGGTGYTSDPTVTVGGAGTGATATASRTGTVVTGVTITAGGTGYGIGATPAVRYRALLGRAVISNPYLNNGAPLSGYVLYPWIVRHSSAFTGSGVNLVIDGVVSDVSGGVATATMGKSGGFGYQHYLTWISNAGVQQITPYIPPVYP